MIKIVFFGTPEFAAINLNKLIEDDGIDVITVVSQEDKPIGRKKILTAPPVKTVALKHNIPVIQARNKQELTEKLKNLEADLFVVIAYGMVLPKEILKMPRYGCVNIHASLLPKYRGASPIQESLLNDDKETGISLIKMNEKLDEGDIIFIKRCPIDSHDNYESLSLKLAVLSAEFLPHVLKDFKEGALSPLPQSEKNVSYCRKIDKKDGEIDNKKTAEDILNMIRAYTPWPTVYIYLGNKKLRIIEADYSPEDFKSGEFKLDGDMLKLGTAKGSLVLNKVQIEGKNEMNIKEFLNGYRKMF